MRRWFDNLAVKSLITATVYLRTLGYCCKLNKTSPKTILEVCRSKDFRDDFTDFVRRLEKEGKAGSYIARFKKTLHSWFAYNGLNVRLKVNIRGEYETPTIADERVPSKEELEKIIRMATPRGRGSIALMAFGGLRPETLGNCVGSDGLRIRDLSEAELKNNSIEFPEVPTLLSVRKGLSKTRHKYFTLFPAKELPTSWNILKTEGTTERHLLKTHHFSDWIQGERGKTSS